MGEITTEDKRPASVEEPRNKVPYYKAPTFLVITTVGIVLLANSVFYLVDLPQFAPVHAYTAGLVLVLVMGALYIGPILEKAAPKERIEEADSTDKKWAPLVFVESTPHGYWVGLLECTLIYTVLCFQSVQGPELPEQAALVIAAYLAFKVASKWEVWAHVYRVPESLKDNEIDLEFLKFRTRWGAYLFTRFTIGTILNLLIALFASLVFRYLVDHDVVNRPGFW